MSRTTEKHTGSADASDLGTPGIEPADPQPWRNSEDAKGWRVIARGQRRANGAPAPLIRLSMHLNAAQSDWLRQEAERTGLGYDEVMLRLLEDARSEAPGTGSAPAT